MTDDTKQVEAPNTRAAWRAALRATADMIMTAKPRPSRAGNLAGALTACASQRPYSHGDVTHQPGDERTIVYAVNPRVADALAVQLKGLNLPGVADIVVEQAKEGKRAKLILKSFPLPQS